MNLRIPLIGATAATLAIAVGVPVAMLDSAEHQRAREGLNATVSYAALDLVATARTVKGKLDISRFSSVAYRPGQPASVFIDNKGGQIDGDVTESKPFLASLLRRAKTNDNRPIRIGDRAVVVEPIASPEAPDTLLAAAVSYVDAAPLDREIAAGTRTRWAVAVGGWLLLSFLLCTALLRLLGRPLNVAAGERTFFADAAHELKTPWALVRTHAERAQRALAAKGEGREADELGSIATTATAAAQTVDNMLMLARLDQGVVGEAVRLRLDALVDTCVSDLKDHHGEDLDVDFAAMSPVAVSGNEALLRHAVGNLLENAVRHGDTPIRLELARVSGKARLTVTDSGAGIPPSQRELVFARFHRASARGGGSGLGLSITQAVVEAHRGKITYAERVDANGAVFTIELPAA